MVDESLSYCNKEKLPLRSLFLDLNSYFASVEQQEDPSLRGKPVAVVPMIADNTFVIAASYEAKRMGVKTLCRVGDALRICPDLKLVTGGHTKYSWYHERVLAAVENVLPIDKVCSIDEMCFRLVGQEQTPEGATKVANRLKKAIAEDVGECLTCSVGIAPNTFLAKVGTELQKPNGLVVIEQDAVFEKLSSLGLTDLPGINVRMRARLQAAGIFTVEQLLTTSREDLRRGFGSVWGERWWYMLRGHELNLPTRSRQSMGHSHVLAPDLRNDASAREVLLRLVQKAGMRLRSEGLLATRMDVYVQSYKRSWSSYRNIDATQTSATFVQIASELWNGREMDTPLKVGCTFSGLRDGKSVTPSLFDETNQLERFSHTMDHLNQRFGKHSVFLASMHQAKDAAPERIAFGKTQLFSEGLADNRHVSPFNTFIQSS